VSAEEAAQIAVEAFVYFYPLVTMEITRRQATTGPADAKPGHGPMGRFHHIRTYPAAGFKEVVRPNFDTLYSSAWLDVSTEPMIVTAPASSGRFYMLPCYDMWTDVFAAPGTRTSGDGPISFALTTPHWHGVLPAGVERIDSPTPTVWVIGRTQTNGPKDYPNVNAFQDAMSIRPLSAWDAPAPPQQPQPVDDPSVDLVTPPLEQVHAMPAADYFRLAWELAATHPPHATDWGQLARLRRLGFRVGEPFDANAQGADVQDALTAAPAAAQALMVEQARRLAPIVDGWMSTTNTMGVYGDFYLKRAIVTMIGLGANQPEDAVYPVLQVDADGAPLDGSGRYVIHFPAGQLPPVDAFWSVTMYDAQGFQAANELDRFAIGDRDDLTYNADGSLDLYLQHENPGPDRVANWLPAPLGPLGVTMRLYLPQKPVFTGEWTPPAVRRLS
jgi:hypothetical protein